VKPHCFGSWADPDGAKNRYLPKAENLYSGRPAETSLSGVVTVADVVINAVSLCTTPDRVTAFNYLTTDGGAVKLTVGRHDLGRQVRRSGPLRLLNRYLAAVALMEVLCMLGVGGMSHPQPHSGRRNDR